MQGGFDEWNMRSKTRAEEKDHFPVCWQRLLRSVRMLKLKVPFLGHLDPFQFILRPYHVTEVNEAFRTHILGQT